MTSSPDELPPALASMWRLCRLGYSHEPWLLGFAFAMTLLAAVPDALLALWLKLLADGVVDGDDTRVLVAALGMAGSVLLTWLLRLMSTRITRRFRDKVTIALETHVASLQASVSTVEHHERRDYLDRLSVLRNQIFVLDHMYMSMFSTCGWIVRLGLTMALLASIHPLLVLLVLFAAPTVITASWRSAAEREVEERGAERARLADHLFDLVTTASAGKEVRITGVGPSLAARRRSEWDDWYADIGKSRWVSAAWHSAAWSVFGSAYVAAVVFVASVLEGSAGDVLLVLAAGARLSAYVGATMSEIGFLRGVWLDGSRRLVWLENYAAAMAADADQPAPDALTDGIRLNHVSFAYPGTDTLVLDDVSLHLPAGVVVAVVGENGAGKSTL
ncbi:MAG: ABC transporter ATP-binding protein, partial [Propionibacteriales bacterium]|nr:ABC transporter ATP-binding protein [Propionibacteriales bacterium]